jgi:hypothetical protein
MFGLPPNHDFCELTVGSPKSWRPLKTENNQTGNKSRKRE